MQSDKLEKLLDLYYTAYVKQDYVEYKNKKWGNMKLIFINSKNEKLFINPIIVKAFFKHEKEISYLKIQNGGFTLILKLEQILDLVPDIENINFGLDFEKIYTDFKVK